MKACPKTDQPAGNSHCTHLAKTRPQLACVFTWNTGKNSCNRNSNRRGVVIVGYDEELTCWPKSPNLRKWCQACFIQSGRLFHSPCGLHSRMFSQHRAPDRSLDEMSSNVSTCSKNQLFCLKQKAHGVQADRQTQRRPKRRPQGEPQGTLEETTRKAKASYH